MLSVLNMHPYEEFLNVLKPLYFFNSIFCVRKYSFRDRTVSPITSKEVAVTLSANCFLIYLFYSTFQLTEFKVLSLKIYYFVIYGQHLFQFSIISCYNMSLSKTYVALIKKLQEIFCFERHHPSPKSLRRKLGISCGLLMYIYIGVIIPKLVLDPFWNYARALFLGLTIIIDLELMFIIFVTRFLSIKMQLWAKVANKLPIDINISNQNVDTNIESRITVKSVGVIREQVHVTEVSEENDPEDSGKAINLFVVFNQLVDCTHLMKSASQFTIFFHAFTLFTQSLVYIGVLMMWIAQAEYNMDIEKSVLTSHSTGIVLWITKALILQALLGRATEELFTGARAAKTAACVLIARRCDLQTTRSAKNVLRLADNRLSRFNAVGALPVDAALPLRLAALVISYTVVLLQFALL